MKKRVPRSGITLIRLVLLELHPAPAQANHFSGEVGKVRLETLGSAKEGEDLSMLLAGEYGLLNRPKLDAEGQVVIPTVTRKRIEAVLETVANLLSVFEGISRSISSPIPCVALKPETDDAREWLAKAKGIKHQDRLVDIPYGSSTIPFEGQLLNALTDRFDGVSLLAEAFAQDHAVGRLRELFRVFERAFALPPGQLVTPLSVFLDPRYGYTTAEVNRWFVLRGPATHADRRPDFVLESDVRPILRRMEQAALDTLLNKKTWRTRSVDRRSLWEPTGWTKSARGNQVFKLGSTGRIGVQMLDQFGTFPTDLRRVVAGRLPPDWWAPASTPKTPTRPFRVIR